MSDHMMRTALKEWAVAVKALDEGKQIVLLRKGGIREEGKEFRVVYPRFLLYPTYEHQREGLVKPVYQADLAETIANRPSEEWVSITHWAEVTETVEVDDQERVDALSPLYIWTTDYAQKRLHWKPRKPLTVMLVRVYRLREPRTIPVLAKYGGCTSWLELAEEIGISGSTPVLTDEAYRRQVEAARERLGLAPTRA